ncbi:MAG TPA: hypothetical protein ENN97_10060 [Phycisphaerales bacterium]|nr:hypothetical protein [Phycisphaerales bacterium]
MMFSWSDYHPGLSSCRAMLKEVAALYRRLDEAVAACDQAAPCRACGNCCDFEAFGHRLYITTPELLYFAHHVGRPLKPMTDGVCPYRIDGRCSIYPRRFVGCRIFQCGGSAAAQSDLTEATLKQLKHLCRQFRVPYYYMDLKTALNSP